MAELSEGVICRICGQPGAHPGTRRHFDSSECVNAIETTIKAKSDRIMELEQAIYSSADDGMGGTRMLGGLLIVGIASILSLGAGLGLGAWLWH